MRKDAIVPDNELTSPGNNRYFTLGGSPRFDSVGFILSNNAPSATFPHGSTSLCGGTFVAAHTVVTAAHCVYDANGLLRSPAEMLFGLGRYADPASPSSYLYNVYNITVRPDYIAHSLGLDALTVGGKFVNKGFQGDNDLAIIQVGSLAYGAPILPTIYNGPAPIGANVIITGYGAQTSNSNPFDNAHSPTGTKLAGLNVFDRLDGSGKKIEVDFDSPGRITAEGLPSNYLEYITQPGDSGSGIFINDPAYVGPPPAGYASDALIGVVSSGMGDGQYGSTNSFTYLPPYYDWLAANSFGPVDASQLPGYTITNPYTPRISPDLLTLSFLGIPVVRYIPYYFDPITSEAFAFENANGPLFGSVQMTFTDSDDHFDIYLFDAAVGRYVYVATVESGEWYDFAGAGVERFAVGGIVGGPDDPVFGLKFASGGFANFDQKVTNLAVAGGVPEPSTWTLLLLGLAAVGYTARFRARTRVKGTA